MDTDVNEPSKANKATGEERAFLQSMDKEEAEQKMAALLGIGLNQLTSTHGTKV